MAKKEKRETLKTPECEIIFPHLAEPDTTFDEAGKFSVTGVFDPANEEHKAFLASIKAEVGDGKCTPIKPHLDRDKKETGQFRVAFSTKFGFQVVDSQGQEASPVGMGYGTRLVIAYQVNHHELQGGGVNLYLKGVQIMEWVEMNQEDLGFKPKDGGFRADEKVTNADGSESDDSDPLPF